MDKKNKPILPNRTFLKREEIIDLVRPLIPSVSKYMSRDEVMGILKRKRALEERVINVREDQEGIWILVDGNKFLIPTQVMWPKMRAFTQLIDAPQNYDWAAWKAVFVNDEWNGLVFLDSTSGSVVYVNGAEITNPNFEDSSEIAITTVGSDVNFALKNGSIDETKLDTSVNASLDLADTAVQPATLSSYQLTSQKDSANGYAWLDAGGKINSAQLPDIAISDFLGNFTNTTAALADAWVQASQKGDWFTVDTGGGQSWIVTTSLPTTLADITQLKTPTGAVTSVFSRTGAITAQNGDYTASQITNVPAGGIASVTVQTALDELDTEKAPKDDPTFTTKITTPVVHASSSAGLLIEANWGTDIGLLGAGSGAGVTWYGWHNYDLATQDTIAWFLWAGKTLSTLPTATYPSLTELAYVKGVTSAIQTQLDGKLEPTDIASWTITPRADDINFSGWVDGDVLTVQADGSLALEAPASWWANTALSNLSGVAINTSLVSDTDETDDLGTTLKKWLNIFVKNIGATATRVTKGWFTDIESTNMPTVGGTPILSSLTAPQFTTVELGHASDTTLSRVSAWVVAVEWKTLANLTDGGTFAADISVPDEAYGVGWNGSVEVPTKNAIYDKIETLWGGAYQLMSYTSWTNTASFTITGLDLSTDLRWKVLIKTEPNGSASAAVITLRINGISTASSYWYNRTMTGIDSGGSTATDNVTEKSNWWKVTSSTVNSSIIELDFSLVDSNRANSPRPTVRWNATTSGENAADTFFTGDGGGFQDTQTNITSITVEHGSARDFYVWVLKPKTS